MSAASTSAMACSVPPVTCNHKADPLLFGQQCNVMRCLPGDKAVRPAVDGLLQVAAAPR